jgi:hypothetical protein
MTIEMIPLLFQLAGYQMDAKGLLENIFSIGSFCPDDFLFVSMTPRKVTIGVLLLN